MKKFSFHVGDELPRLVFAIVDGTSGSPIDLSAESTTITIYVQEFGGTGTNVVEAPCSKIGSGAQGQCMVIWPDGAFDELDPGDYEAEIAILFDGRKQTVDDHFKITLKEAFAPA